MCQLCTSACWQRYDLIQGVAEMKQEENEYPHWNRVYAVVVIYTIIVIGAIWLFSKQFQ